MSPINTPQLHFEEHHHHPHAHEHREKKLRKLLFRLAYSNTYLALPILAITAESYVYQKSFAFDWMYLGFITFSTLFLYPIHRLVGIFITPEIDYTKAQKEVARHPEITRYAVVIGALGSAFLGTQISMFQLQWIVPLAIISIAYSLPILPTTNGWKRVRDIPGVKIFIVTGVVTILTSTIPMMDSSVVSYSDLWLFGAERWTFLLAITIPFDVRDITLDTKWNLKTIPLLIGAKKAMRLAILLVYASLFIHIFHFFYTDILSWEIGIATLVASGLTHFVLIDFEHRNSYLYNAWMIEGMMMYHFALVTIAAILSDWA